MSSRRKPKLFKLALPLNIKRNDSEVAISDGFFSHSIALQEWNTIALKSIDSDGFVLFKIDYAEPKKEHISAHAEAGINGYTLFHQSVPKAKSYGTKQSVYEYYKRDNDLDYYVLIRRGAKTKKLKLGSLLDSESRIFQMARVIHDSFRNEDIFDRKRLSPSLPSRLRARRLLKAILDILTAEGFLVRKERKVRGQLHEEFVKTKNLERFMFDPRSYSKPLGVRSVEP